MDKVLAAIERFRTDMAAAGIAVSGFEVRTSTQERMLEAMAAGVAVTMRGQSGFMYLNDLRVLVREPRS